jgi:hypothetical protein
VTLDELASVILAAPPLSSVRDAVNGGWSKEAELQALLLEHNSGLIKLSRRLPRPGVDDHKPELSEAQLKANIGHDMEAAAMHSGNGLFTPTTPEEFQTFRARMIAANSPDLTYMESV